MLFTFSFIRYISVVFLVATLHGISTNIAAASSQAEKELREKIKNYSSFKETDLSELTPFSEHMKEMRTSFAQAKPTVRLSQGLEYITYIMNKGFWAEADEASKTLQISSENFNKGKIWSKLALLRAISTPQLESKIDKLINRLPKTGIFKALPFRLIDSVENIEKAILNPEFGMRTHDFLTMELCQRGQEGLKALNKIAHNKYKLKDFKLAAFFYSFALDTNSNLAISEKEKRTLYRKRGFSLAKLQQWEKALKDNYEQIPNANLPASSLANMGAVYAMTKEYLKAIDHYTWALEKAAKYTAKPLLTEVEKWDIYKWRGYSLSMLGRWKEALEKNYNLIPNDKRDSMTLALISEAKFQLIVD